MKLIEFIEEPSNEKFKYNYYLFKEFFEKNFERYIDNENLSVFIDDECMIIEWIFKNFRYGFVMENNPDKSSFYFVSNEIHGELTASALLNDPVCSELIKLINKRIF